jgi:3-methyladenine DNA glycosylase AlkD
MHPYIVSLKKLFEKNANPPQAASMKKYMRDQFEYLGIKTPRNTALQKEFYAEHGLPEVTELDSILRDLWSLSQREFQYVGLGLLDKLEKKLPAKFIKTIEYLVVTKPWWDTVDAIASHTVGTHFRRFPDVREKYLTKWRISKNLWLRRTAILFQLNYKKETDFINKAIGWALRQYARVDPKAVSKFVKSTPLHPLSRREAMKHLEE